MQAICNLRLVNIQISTTHHRITTIQPIMSWRRTIQLIRVVTLITETTTWAIVTLVERLCHRQITSSLQVTSPNSYSKKGQMVVYTHLTTNIATRLTWTTWIITLRRRLNQKNNLCSPWEKLRIIYSRRLSLRMRLKTCDQANLAMINNMRFPAK